MILDEIMQRDPELECCRADLTAAAEALIRAFEKGGKLLTCGNGGSCSDAEHIVGELAKGFLKKRPLSEAQKARFADRELADRLQDGLPALSLNSPALTTAVINDLGGELHFAQAAWALAREGDVLLGLSTSGNAKNVAMAVEAAKARGAVTVGFTGMGGGKLAKICDIAVRAPETETYRVQECHLKLYHALCAMVEEHFFDR